MGGETTDEQTAAMEAYTHATGRAPEASNRPTRTKGPLQSETLFDPEPYAR